MVRYQSADAVAAEELVGRLSPALMRFLTTPYVSRSDAEDLLQDCWLRIHRARDSYRPSEPLLPWIFAIARHAKLDGYRRMRRRGVREVLVGDVPESAMHSMSGYLPGGHDLEAMLTALPESQREVIVMLKVSGMSLEEVARATASTTGAIKQKAHRAYAKLREFLTKDNDDAS